MPAGYVTIVLSSKRTGRYRGWLDIGVCTDPAAALRDPAVVPFLNKPGWGVHTHISNGDTWLAHLEFQALTAVETGNVPFHLLPVEQDYVNTMAAAKGVTLNVVHDRYVHVDANNKVVAHAFIDPDCGDQAYPGHTLQLHDEADPSWSFDGKTFTAPAAKTKT